MPKKKMITNNPDAPVIIRLYGGKEINLTPAGARPKPGTKKILPERIMKKLKDEDA